MTRPVILCLLASSFFFIHATATTAQESIASAASTTQPYLLQMIRDDAVHQALRLSEKQRDAVIESLREVDPRWWVSRILPAEKQQAEITGLTELLRLRLGEILDQDQQQRLLEIERQAHGTRLPLRSDAVAALGLTATQLEHFKELYTETDTAVTKLQQQLKANEIDSAEATRRQRELQATERAGVKKLLTLEQQSKLGPFVGKTFDFASVRRTYPLAPEFVLDGATWIYPDRTQSTLPRMSDLRGKVVAVFFYAFQCINCQRNFPHYKAWHADMADSGLVIIGIQTPETSAERDQERVQQALKSDDFQFPVLFDEKSGNWRAWGNTMWPTTYLIDKQGFIRRWWQGEMNWQGTPGEQQMRQTIQQLLAEPDAS